MLDVPKIINSYSLHKYNKARREDPLGVITPFEEYVRSDQSRVTDEQIITQTAAPTISSGSNSQVSGIQLSKSASVNKQKKSLFHRTNRNVNEETIYILDSTSSIEHVPALRSDTQSSYGQAEKRQPYTMYLLRNKDIGAKLKNKKVVQVGSSAEQGFQNATRRQDKHKTACRDSTVQARKFQPEYSDSEPEVFQHQVHLNEFTGLSRPNPTTSLSSSKPSFKKAGYNSQEYRQIHNRVSAEKIYYDQEIRMLQRKIAEVSEECRQLEIRNERVLQEKANLEVKAYQIKRSISNSASRKQKIEPAELRTKCNAPNRDIPNTKKPSYRCIQVDEDEMEFPKSRQTTEAGNTNTGYGRNRDFWNNDYETSALKSSTDKKNTGKPNQRRRGSSMALNNKSVYNRDIHTTSVDHDNSLSVSNSKKKPRSPSRSKVQRKAINNYEQLSAMIQHLQTSLAMLKRKDPRNKRQK